MALAGVILLGAQVSPTAAEENGADAGVAESSLPSPEPQLSVDLTGEARLRFESYAEPEWGNAADDGFLWLRAIAKARVRAGPAQIVFQPIIGHSIGVAGGPGPVDRTGIDLLQASAEWRIPLKGGTHISVGGGRKLIALGSERLVGTRYGPNIPQAFDTLQVSAVSTNARLELLDAHAVRIGPGNFDDTSSGGRRVKGAYLTLKAAQDVSFDLYWIGYRDMEARFAGTTGDERRDTFGLRMFGQWQRISWNWETMVQRGRFAGRDIRAWSQATETSVDFPDAPMAPRVRLRANIASGDKAQSKNRVESFNAMFPKGRYFGELTPLGPRNIININPGLLLRPAPRVQLELNVAAFWRASPTDGIYDLAGRELRRPGANRARHVGNLIEASMGFDREDGLSIAASIGVFTAGQFTQQSGAGRAIMMLGGEVRQTF
jgi:hypothetical protein